MGLSAGVWILLVLVAAMVAMAAKRLSLPYTVGLVLAGLALAVFPVFETVRLTKEVIFQVFLPPLIFESAMHIRWKEFSRDLPVSTVLAVPGVVVSALVTALGMHLWLDGS